MQNEENTVIQDETQMENEVVLEEAPAEEIVEDSQGEDATVTPEVKLTYEQKLAIATTPEEKFAIADAHANTLRRILAKKQKVEAPRATPKAPQLSNGIDEAMIESKILKSQGMSDELLTELVALSKVRGKSLLDTQSDPLFIALKESKEAEAKSAKAKLGASKGSGSVKAEKGFDTPGLTEEEHKEMWRKSQGR